MNGNRNGNDHWLVRRGTVRRLKAGFGVVLALVVLAQAVIMIKSYAGLDDWPGFAAVFGFLCCLLMVLLARALGALLKRRDDYYDV